MFIRYTYVREAKWCRSVGRPDGRRARRIECAFAAPHAGLEPTTAGPQSNNLVRFSRHRTGNIAHSEESHAQHASLLSVCTAAIGDTVLFRCKPQASCSWGQGCSWYSSECAFSAAAAARCRCSTYTSKTRVRTSRVRRCSICWEL